MYAKRDWYNLVLDISKTGLTSDLSYFLLGRAAEELGFYDAALTYYQLARSSDMYHDNYSANQYGISLPADINQRISSIEEALYRRASVQMVSKVESKKLSAVEVYNIAIENFSLKDIKEKVAIVLDGVRTKNIKDVNKGIEQLNNINHPQHGDRNAAKSFNAEGLKAVQRSSFDEAVYFFASAASTDPADPEMLDNLSFAFLKIMKFLEARSAVLCALSLAPTRTSAWANLGTVLAYENKEDSAVASFILAYRFSRNKNKTHDYLLGLQGTDFPPSVQQSASKALIQIDTQK
jgi:tetratricopeptide (TPR) repeat protein